MMRNHSVVKLFFVLICSASIAAASWSTLDEQDNRKAMWKKVNAAVGKGLPKTAIKELRPIIKSAIKDEKYAEAVKAITHKIALEGTVQGNRAEEKIVRLQASMEDLPQEVQPVMEALLAHWYWHYFQQNRWRFMQRTQTAVSPSDDIQTWALPQILAEIDKHFVAALKQKDVLRKIPIANWDDLLNKGAMGDEFRPTLYDFLAHEALRFYQSGEQAGARQKGAFDLMANGPIFSNFESFKQWSPKSTDETSPIRKATQLLRELMVFHENDDNPLAFADLELARYGFGNNHAFGEDKTDRYLAALNRFAEAYREFPIYSRAQAAKAAVRRGQADLVAARAEAEKGVYAFPKSVGANMCRNVIANIERKTLAVQAERVWNSSNPEFVVNYTNIEKVYFRLIPNDIVGRLGKGTVQYERNVSPKELGNHFKEWSVDLPKTTDYQQRTHQVKAPQGIPKGSYWLVASAKPGFGKNENQVDVTNIWVSDLAVILRSEMPDNRGKLVNYGGMVLDAKSGVPIANATIRYWVLTTRNQRRNKTRIQEWKEQAAVKTDRNGLFVLKNARQKMSSNQVVVVATNGNDSLCSDRQYLGAGPGSHAGTHTNRYVLFTDRSIYRPGQTVSFKGICTNLEPSKNRYSTISGRKVKVDFFDTNRKNISSMELVTNDFGSFSGSFTAPRDRATGMMSIVANNGTAHIRVEEYKRPKFEVSIEVPKQEVKLEQTIKVSGKATAYTGAAIDGASVRWRVVREVRYPQWWYWRCWWYPPIGASQQEIAHGTSETNLQGVFDLEFVAAPDRSVLKESEPTFRYSIYADVTDPAGETRSDSQVVNAGYTTLKASVSVSNTVAKNADGEKSANPRNSLSNWLVSDRSLDLRIKTQTLNNIAASAGGSLTIFGVRQPDVVHRQKLYNQRHFRQVQGRQSNERPKDIPINWRDQNAWPLGKEIHAEEFTTDASGDAVVSLTLPAGVYRAKLRSKDQFGTPISAEITFHVLNPSQEKLSVKIPEMLAAPNWQCRVGEEFTALWGSGYDSARCLVEVIHRGALLKQYWTNGEETQIQIKQKVTENMRGGFWVRTTVVRENRLYFHNQFVNVPWDNKNLTVKWERFVSKLKPGAKEVWTAVVTGPDARGATAEMVATLYDSSLDAFAPHRFLRRFNGFRRDATYVYPRFQNSIHQLRRIHGHWNQQYHGVALTYRTFPGQLLGGYGYMSRGRMLSKSFDDGPASGMGFGDASGSIRGGGAMLELASAAEAPSDRSTGRASRTKDSGGPGVRQQGGDDGSSNGKKVDLDNVAARTNLNETAFFYPHLVSESDGSVRIEFTMPEALTKWNFFAFAHDTDMRSGYLNASAVTSKDLMVQPNPPRFLREGDELEFTVKVSNQSAAQQSGIVRLTFADARTLTNVDNKLGNQDLEKEFEIPSKESRTLSWRIKVSDSLGVLVYKAVGSTGRLSDGEEAFLPVLSRRVLVTESLPLPIRGKSVKQFDFATLLKSDQSDSLEHKSLTFQMVSNPSWYAIMSLPYLMEYPHQCSEQIFNRYYANLLARQIALSNPKIRRVFDSWKGTDALDSPLEKNEDLKSVMIQETPWLLEAKNESQARRNIGILFDENRLNREMKRALMQLSQQQLPDGQWPWFGGGRGNPYITLYIATGFARLRHMGVDTDLEIAKKAIASLDEWMRIRFDRIEHKDKYHLSSTDALYLYCRSFYSKDVVANARHQEAIDYYLGVGRKHWLSISSRQSKAHVSLALKRYGHLKSSQEIMRSILEHSVNDEEMGRYWRDTEFSIWWYQAPIETQAIMIEALDEVMGDAQAVEDCKVWLLKQKQTRNWKTTKGTADAVYALMLRGKDLLASDELVQMTVAGKTIQPVKVESGTGFYEKRFSGSEITPKHGSITLTKADEGVSWGSAHWQYLEDMSKVSLYDGTPLKVTKDLFVKVDSDKGPVLEKVNGPISVGDNLVVRITLRTDRDMEFVHLKDFRGSGTEPVDVISRYRYQDGLAYYQSTKDTATHFFIDYLPKGVYVFEYSVRPQLAGRYQTGFANLQSMYAPEFGAHSESHWLEVKKD